MNPVSDPPTPLPTGMQPTRQGVSNHSKLLNRWIAKWSRWLHIYLSMVSLGAIFFFSVTGLTLNHPSWFFRESTRSIEGNLDRKWLHIDQPPPNHWNESDFGHQIDKLQVTEFLRANHRLSGRVSEFLTFSDECELTFEGPGYAATARIERETGSYKLSITSNDLVSVLNDLHKGRHTGPIWSWVIDVSAVLSAIVALSGFLLVFYLKLNRLRRIVISVVGALSLVALVIVAMG